MSDIELLDILSSYRLLLTSIRTSLPDRYQSFSLGTVYTEDMYMFYPTNSKSSVLVTAGFHGNEYAGPWGIAKFIEENKVLIDKVDICFIPVCNLEGFKNKTRYNNKNQYSNYFCNKDGLLNVEFSYESSLLVKHFDLLKQYAKNGYLDCHENEYLKDEYYIYVNGSNKKLERKLLDAGNKYFHKRKDGRYSDVGKIVDIADDSQSYCVKDGIVRDLEDGTFSECLYLSEVPITVTVETPMKNDFMKRMSCQAEFIKTFVKDRNGL